jgi:hypothetical protein
MSDEDISRAAYAALEEDDTFMPIAQCPLVP